MSKTTIPWVISPDGTPGEVWNPSTGCSKGCPYCYARRLHDQRHAAGMKGYEAPFTEPRMMPDRLSVPLRRRKPTTWFVDSMGDLFDPAILFEYIAAVFGIMAATPRHRYILLTKRPERMEEWYVWAMEDRRRLAWAMPSMTNGDMVSDRLMFGPWPLPNVWIGTSITNQPDADERILHLLRCPAAVRLVSVEPMVGPVDISPWLPSATCPECGSGLCDEDGCCTTCGADIPAATTPGIDWVICGGETGSGARPLHPDWVRSLRDQCVSAGVPFFFKQWGEYVTEDQSPEDIILPGRSIMPWCGFDKDHEPTGDLTQVFRTGRAAAGCILDGRTWEQTP